MKITNIKTLASIFIFTLLGLLANAAHSQVQKVDQVIAIVDDDIILSSELSNRLNSIKQRFGDRPEQLPPESILREQVLERLVSESIQLQLAERMGIYIEDEQVNQAFVQLAQGQGLTPKKLLDELSRQGESLTLMMRDLRRELTLNEVQQAQVNRRIFVSNAEVDNFLKSAEGQFWQQPSLNLRHIFFTLASNASPAEVTTAQNLAKSVSERLGQGEDFASMAVQFSNGPSALKGGPVGWRRAIEFPPEISEALASATPGTITQPIRSSGGIHIFQVADIRGGDQAEMVQQSKVRHILIKPNQIRSLDEARELVAELRQRAIAGEAFADLAKEYSEDISNSLKGGDLDWVLPGQMVPPFEAMMNATEVGEVSEPVQTRFGWHILKVDDRKEEDMSSNIMRNQARNVLRSQRYPEELDLWTREIRSDAFVSIME